MTLEEKILKEFRELYTREIGKYVWFNSDASMSAFKAGDTGKIGKTIEAFISHAIQEAEKAIERKYCKFVGVETTDGSYWCETHDKWEHPKSKNIELDQKREGKEIYE